jgi:bifunctional UDP-N-acetylglucosamine pyrophosphorylase/glucosamine-1-phosphate N-acetyltransferase
MEELKLEYYFKEMDKFPCKEIFENCTYPWEVLAKTKSFLQEKLVDKNIKENKAESTGEFCTFNGNYFIDEGTKISSRVTIEGPVYIGKNCEICPGAYIRPGTIIGDNAVVRI